MNINNYIKPDKWPVIELNDVEYLVDSNAIRAISIDAKIINLIRLVDRKKEQFPLEQIRVSFQKRGVIDYIDRQD